MKRLTLLLVVFFLLGSSTVFAEGGNGAPSGGHYNLNIIGVPQGKNAEMDGNNGHRIFVPLGGTSKIWLSCGDYGVIDANGTDGSAAFQLPNPDPTNCGTTTYSVYARALGKPGGRSTTTTGIYDPVTGDYWYSIYQMVLVRDVSQTGKSTFTNVSKELLYVYADVNGDGKTERVPLFGAANKDFFWEYNNSGLKVAQLRFYYDVPTTVPAP